MTHGWLVVCIGLMIVGGGLGRDCAAEAPPDKAPQDTFAALLADYEVQQETALAAVESAKTEAETAAAWKSLPDLLVFSRRALAIAAANPQTADARDALLWIVYQPSHGFPKGERGEIERTAVQLLLAHHADDVEVARVALLMNHNCWLTRERLLEGLVARSTTPETVALARLALARYWIAKIEKAEAVQRPDAPTKSANADYAETYADLRACDIAATRVKAAAMLDEVIAKYGDVTFVRGGQQREVDQKRGEILRTVAEKLLDETRNFVLGKRAPEISGEDLNGDPLKLSDYRGKVVVLVFWASWCGPCMEEVPHDLALIAKYKDEPFALIGVTCDEDLAAAQEAAATHRISWRNWQDPLTEKGEGPIAHNYHVHSLPGVFVIDAQGTLRAKNCRGERLDKVVAELLKEKKAGP